MTIKRVFCLFLGWIIKIISRRWSLNVYAKWTEWLFVFVFKDSPTACKYLYMSSHSQDIVSWNAPGIHICEQHVDVPLMDSDFEMSLTHACELHRAFWTEMCNFVAWPWLSVGDMYTLWLILKAHFMCWSYSAAFRHCWFDCEMSFCAEDKEYMTVLIR